MKTIREALGINDDSLGAVLVAVPVALGVAFNQWQSYQAHGCFLLS